MVEAWTRVLLVGVWFWHDIVCVASKGSAACEALRGGWKGVGCELREKKHHGCRFVHIPKTGGSSLKAELSELGIPVDSHESCFWDDYRLEGVGADTTNALTFLRAPRQHVLSQFMECGWSHFGVKHTSVYAGLFPEKPPFPSNRSDGLEVWLKHFLDPAWTYDGAGDWDCYNPSNMQARALSCGAKFINDTAAGAEFFAAHAYERRRLSRSRSASSASRSRRLSAEEWVRNSLKSHHTNAHHVRRDGVGPSPPLDVAAAGLDAADGVGITELYHESVCVLRYRIEATLPAGCACSSTVASTHVHDDRGVPKHSIDDVAPSVLALVDDLTRVDASLYLLGLDRVLGDIAKLETCAQTTIICPEKWATLRQATAYLPGAADIIDRHRGATTFKRLPPAFRALAEAP